MMFQVEARHETNLGYLSRLADIVSSIDDGKADGGFNIELLGESGILLIQEMKTYSMDTGVLYELFKLILFLQNHQEDLQVLIEKAHAEIVRLLGEDAWKFYSSEE